jgi:hypothetical protein
MSANKDHNNNNAEVPLEQDREGAGGCWVLLKVQHDMTHTSTILARSEEESESEKNG